MVMRAEREIPQNPREYGELPTFETFDSIAWFQRSADVVKKSMKIEASEITEPLNLNFLTTLQPTLNPAFPLARIWNTTNQDAGEVWYFTNYGWIREAHDYPSNKATKQSVKEQFSDYYSSFMTIFDRTVSEIVGSEDALQKLRETGFLDLSDTNNSSEPDIFVASLATQTTDNTVALAKAKPDMFEHFEQDAIQVMSSMNTPRPEYSEARDAEAFEIDCAATLERFGSKVSVASEPAASIRIIGNQGARHVLCIPQYVKEDADRVQQKSHYYWVEGTNIKRFTETESKPTDRLLDEKSMQDTFRKLGEYFDTGKTDVDFAELTDQERSYILYYLENIAKTARIYTELQDILHEGQKNPAKKQKTANNIGETEVRVFSAGERSMPSVCYGLEVFDIVKGTKNTEPTITWTYGLSPSVDENGEDIMSIIWTSFDRRDNYLSLRASPHPIPKDTEKSKVSSQLVRYVANTPFDTLVKTPLPKEKPALPPLSNVIKFHAITNGPDIWDQVQRSLTRTPLKEKASRKR